MRTMYSRGKPQKVLVLTFSRYRMAMFKEITLRNTGYTEISKKYGITKDRARKTSGQFIYWLRRLAQDAKDEELETIILRRETYESNKSVRQYLEAYAELIVNKIDHYEKAGRIKITENDLGTKHEWVLPGELSKQVRR